MVEVVKIDLNSRKNNDGWNLFTEKCLNTCVNYNETNPEFKYTFNYDYDSITITNNKVESGFMLNELKSIELTKDEYVSATSSDKDIIERLLNTIKYTPSR